MKKLSVSKSEMVAITNAVTGEMETAKVTIHVQRDILKYKESFTILFQSATLAQVKEIKPITAKLLLYLNSISLFSNIVDRTTDEIATELGYKRNQVQKGLKQLSDFNIILKTKHPDGRRNLLMINPHQSWKGKPVERAKTLSRLGDLAQLSLFEERPKKGLIENTNFLNEKLTEVENQTPNKNEISQK